MRMCRRAFLWCGSPRVARTRDARAFWLGKGWGWRGYGTMGEGGRPTVLLRIGNLRATPLSIKLRAYGRAVRACVCFVRPCDRCAHLRPSLSLTVFRCLDIRLLCFGALDTETHRAEGRVSYVAQMPSLHHAVLMLLMCVSV